MGKMKKIPEGIMHVPTPMAWAQTTPMSEHKDRENRGIEIDVVPDGSRKLPFPITRASTELRRAYPYIFNAAAYALTHNPEKIDTDLFYSRFTMPYEVFLDYALDDCTEQKQYLKEELYRLLSGQPAKYIKVSETRTVLAQPVVIAFSRTDLRTGKEKRITNIGQDFRVDAIQVQILKELLTFDHGFLNQPKAFYAKTRRAYASMVNNFQFVLDYKEDNDIWKLLTAIRGRASGHINRQDAIPLANVLISQVDSLSYMAQGDFYRVYLALEYIMAHRGKAAKSKEYNPLELCNKCAPDLTQEKNGTLYAKDWAAVFSFCGLVAAFVHFMPQQDKDILRIQHILPCDNNKKLVVSFTKEVT
jgi:hypothetical protein